jgi:hypothetical protein
MFLFSVGNSGMQFLAEFYDNQAVSCGAICCLEIKVVEQRGFGLYEKRE